MARPVQALVALAALVVITWGIVLAYQAVPLKYRMDAVTTRD